MLMLVATLWTPHAAWTQVVLTDVEPAPRLLTAYTRHPEARLAPIPAMFEWMERQVLPNPRLQALLERGHLRQELTFFVSLAETFSDNIDREPNDRQSDFETSGELDTVYRLQHQRGFLSFANSLEAEYQVRSGAGEIGIANLALNAGYQFPRLALALSESLIRNDDFELADARLRFTRSTFLRNRVTPQIRYSFSQNNLQS